MEWTKDAENAVKRVPFFVRKKVRARVETQVAETGKKIVTLADVKTAQKRHLQTMSEEIKGYQIDTCFGPGGCPNRTVPSEKLLERIEKMIAAEDLLSFLKQHVPGDLVGFAAPYPTVLNENADHDLWATAGRKPSEPGGDGLPFRWLERASLAGDSYAWQMRTLGLIAERFQRSAAVNGDLQHASQLARSPRVENSSEHLPPL